MLWNVKTNIGNANLASNGTESAHEKKITEQHEIVEEWREEKTPLAIQFKRLSKRKFFLHF